MIANIIFVVLSFALICFLIFLFVNHLKVKEMLHNFSRCNVMVFGKKGTGKDLIFQKVINSRKNKPYLSNIDYGGNYRNIKVGDLRTGNTYDNFIKNEINIHTKIEENEGVDAFLSDCGIILPSQYDSSLHKTFPEFSSYYALSRHLYKSNVHANTQALSRVWKALREQADYYVNTKRTFKLFGFLVTEVISYDNYHSAENNITPWKRPSGLNSKDAKARYDEFTALNGEIKSFYVFNKIRHIKYDTRAYHNIIFGYKFTIDKKRRKKYARNKKYILGTRFIDRIRKFFKKV